MAYIYFASCLNLLRSTDRDRKIIDRRHGESMNVLIVALGLDSINDIFGDMNARERFAFILSKSDFNQLERMVLRYANAVAAQTEARTQPMP